MVSQEEKINDKQFLIKIYPNLLQIKIALKSILQNDSLHPQISILGTLTAKYSNRENGLEEVILNMRVQLDDTLNKRVQFGYFSNPKIGVLFIAGHLTETFLFKVHEKKLAALPVGLFGIFKGIGIEGKNINQYLTALQNGNFLLIIREEVDALTAIETVLQAS
jgi:hypothetical protein